MVSSGFFGELDRDFEDESNFWVWCCSMEASVFFHFMVNLEREERRYFKGASMSMDDLSFNVTSRITKWASLRSEVDS